MKRTFDWQLAIAVVLVALTGFFYFLHYLIFRDAHHIFIYFLGDVAFVFCEVLLVTLIIHRLLHYRERRALASKLNMLTGAFFSEVGTELLRMCADYDEASHRLYEKLAFPDDWSERTFLNVREDVKSHRHNINGRRGDLGMLHGFLKEKKGFLMDLLQNPSLLEHESFTNLVWLVFHLAEELDHRRLLDTLSEEDYAHVADDIKSIYNLLTLHWMDYIRHLQQHYPSRFSLASRKNPFRKDESAR